MTLGKASPSISSAAIQRMPFGARVLAAGWFGFRR
jgi:hypothetical protein